MALLDVWARYVKLQAKAREISRVQAHLSFIQHFSLMIYLTLK